MALEKIESTPRRVRILFNKKIIADTTSAKLVWEHPYYPTYYLPVTDVQTKYLEKSQITDDDDGHMIGYWKLYRIAIKSMRRLIENGS